MAEFSKGVALHYSCFVQRFLPRPTALVGKERPARHICLLHQESNVENVDALIPIDLDVASVAKQGKSTRVSTARGCVWRAGEWAARYGDQERAAVAPSWAGIQS